ncbi:MAG: hypothetical protein OEW39_08795 [Deltaproteobacteria bacterium]|nr:hypothetical protein [Deltaproteobacteria bacterium]
MRGLFYSAIFAGAFIFLGTVSSAWAQSQAEFPKDWKSWTAVKTPLVEVGAIPGCNADVSKLPPIYQETVATYCGVKPGGPGKVSVLVNPKISEKYKTRKGGFSEGTNMVLHLMDMKVLFVTGTSKGKPTYGVFLEDGKDIAAKDGALSTQTCATCHTGYQSFCVEGQCGRMK